MRKSQTLNESGCEQLKHPGVPANVPMMPCCRPSKLCWCAESPQRKREWEQTVFLGNLYVGADHPRRLGGPRVRRDYAGLGSPIRPHSRASHPRKAGIKCKALLIWGVTRFGDAAYLGNGDFRATEYRGFIHIVPCLKLFRSGKEFLIAKEIGPPVSHLGTIEIWPCAWSRPAPTIKVSIITRELYVESVIFSISFKWKHVLLKRKAKWSYFKLGLFTSMLTNRCPVWYGDPQPRRGVAP